MAESRDKASRKIKFSKCLLFVSMLLFTLMTGLIDFLTHGEIGFSIFYVVYIALMSWMLGVGSSAVIIFIASVLRIVVLTKYGSLSAESLVTYVNWALYTGVMFVISLGISYFRKSLELQRKYQRRDFITDLGNAQDLRETLSRELSRAKRHTKVFSVVVAQSDSYSHLIRRYDESKAKLILKSFAKLFSSSLRETDACTFINENCFVLILPESDSAGTTVVLERLNKRLHSLYAQQDNVHECMLRALSFEALPANVDMAIDLIEEINCFEVEGKDFVQWSYSKLENDNLELKEV